MGEKMIMDKEKSIDSGTLLLIGIVGMIASGLLAIFTTNFFSIIFVGLFIVFLVIFLVGGIKTSLEDKIEKNKVIENMNEFQREYDEYIHKLGITKSDIQVTLFEFTEKRDFFPAHIPHYLWIDNDMLNLFPMSEYYKKWEISSINKPDVSKLQVKSVSIESIMYFEEVGELRKYTTVSGGGTSLKGALLGYVLADNVGAIIGSRESVKTEVVSEDDRRVELIYKNSENEVVNLEFEHDAYNVLKKLLPSKELRKIVNIQSVQTQEDRLNKEKSQNAKEKLVQLSELKNEGLITEEDFLEQKKKILNLL